MAAPTTHSSMIDVDALRVGMFIHLDVGWMAHPFPLSSFRIGSPQQIEALRSLGLKSVRWNTEQSDPAALEPQTARPDSPKPQGEAAGGEPLAGAETLGASPEQPPAPVGAGEASAAVAAILRNAATVVPRATGRLGPASEEHRRLEAQRGALRLCERRYGEATRALKQTVEMAPGRPQAARVQAEALTSALLGKMLGQQELCIRLLGETSGFNASMHAMNVAVISLLMGRSFGFAEGDLLDLGVGAMLHDIGKVEMPFRLRQRDERFTALEQRDYEEHVAHGLAIGRRMGLSAGATLVIAQHHEHADGSGFPLKLDSDSMTLAARIVALVNRYDNLCNPHLVAKALTPHESISLLFAQGKAKFDTSILGAFIRMMGVYPPGSTVQLTDDRYALVVSVNSARPLKPNVVIYERSVPPDEALVIDLEKTDGIGIRRSLKPAQLPLPALEYLSPRQRIAYFFEPAGLALGSA